MHGNCRTDVEDGRKDLHSQSTLHDHFYELEK